MAFRRRDDRLLDHLEAIGRRHQDARSSVRDRIVEMAATSGLPPEVSLLVESNADNDRLIGSIYGRFALANRQRAIGDGEILQKLLDWISDGGLSIILEFILALISAFGGLSATAGVEALSVSADIPPVPSFPERPTIQ